MNKILLIDQQQEILDSLRYVFETNGFRVFTASKGKDAVELGVKHMPDVIMLDMVLPDMDGVESCMKLRGISRLNNTLIVFYTDRNEDYSQVAAFNAGADDYVIRPVKPNVLINRIGALIKRMGKHQVPAVVSFPGIQIDREKYIVHRSNKEITLPKKEFEILLLLSSVPRKVFTRLDISNNIWGEDITKKNRTIDVHIRRLREKLGDSLIKTVKGVGYSFEV